MIDHYCRTLASVSDRQGQQTLPLPIMSFELPGVRLFVRDVIKKRSDLNLHLGLGVLAAARATSEDEARLVAKGHVGTVLNLVALSTLAMCPPADLVSVLQVGEDKCGHLRQLCPLSERTEIVAGTIRIPEETFRPLWEAYDRSPQKTRMLRALSWLRKGVSEGNGVDEFTAYWVGLEVIKSILRDDMRFRVRRPGEWDGVKEVFENDVGRSDFDAIEGGEERPVA